MHMFDTIIIGAGIAGLSAAQYLLENGQDNFLVLECSDKIGGRVATLDFQGKVFPTGPGWLHGRIGNPIFDIITQLGVPIEQCQYNEEAFFVWDVEEGREVTAEYRERSRLFEDGFVSVAEKLEGVEINSNKSILDVLQENSDMFTLNSDIDKTVMFTNKEIYMGASVSEFSAEIDFHIDRIYSLDEEECNFRILDPFGVTKLIDYLSVKFLTKIKLGYKVDTILWDKESHFAEIKINNGMEFKAKNVIITLPCNMLVKGAINFEPKIPSEKILAWEHVPSINYCKLFTKFPRRFWPDKDWLIPVIKNVDPFNELILWQNCSKQNLCSPEDNILVCHFISGLNKGNSRFDVGKETLLEIVEESMKSMFPSTFCKPEEVFFSSHWNNDRFFGSFSISSPGLKDDMITELGSSLGPLHFAGESVSVQLMGTMQAAYITGRKAAKSTFS